MAIRHRAVVVLCVLFTVPAAFALSPRVHVSSVGVDVGTCPRPSPCRTFAYAITQVSPNGDVVALDSAGFGPVTIPFSVHLYGVAGATPIITVATGNGITIDAGNQDVVTISNLLLTGPGLSSAHGVAFNSGFVLEIHDTTFNNFRNQPGSGIWLVRSTPDIAQMFISGCRFLNSANSVTAFTSSGQLSIAISDSRFETNSQGLSIGSGNVRANVHDSDFLRNGIAIAAGVSQAAPALTTPIDVTIERCTFSYNARAISAVADSAANSLNLTIRVANSTITNNDMAIFAILSQVLTRLDGSAATNTMEGNTAGEAFTGTYTAK